MTLQDQAELAALEPLQLCAVVPIPSLLCSVCCRVLCYLAAPITQDRATAWLCTPLQCQSKLQPAADLPLPAAASCHLRLLYDLLLCYRHMEGSNATHPTAGEAGYEVRLNSAQAAAGSRLPAVCWHRVEVHKLPVTAPCLLHSSQTCF